jgi:hypothetical protein
MKAVAALRNQFGGHAVKKDVGLGEAVGGTGSFGRGEAVGGIGS